MRSRGNPALLSGTASARPYQGGPWKQSGVVLLFDELNACTFPVNVCVCIYLYTYLCVCVRIQRVYNIRNPRQQKLQNCRTISCISSQFKNSNLIWAAFKKTNKHKLITSTKRKCIQVRHNALYIRSVLYMILIIAFVWVISKKALPAAGAFLPSPSPPVRISSDAARRLLSLPLFQQSFQVDFRMLKLAASKNENIYLLRPLWVNGRRNE